VPSETTDAGGLRRAVAAYVAAVHRVYGETARRLPPALAESLPLIAAGQFWGAAAATRDLHVVASTDPFEEPAGAQIAEIAGEDPPLQWRVRFYDPVVLPRLAVIGEGGEAVREALGVRNWLYHLVLEPGCQLTEHRAAHAGTALVTSHINQLNPSSA
jgi:hypothetical protein